MKTSTKSLHWYADRIVDLVVFATLVLVIASAALTTLWWVIDFGGRDASGCTQQCIEEAFKDRDQARAKALLARQSFYVDVDPDDDEREFVSGKHNAFWCARARRLLRHWAAAIQEGRI